MRIKVSKFLEFFSWVGPKIDNAARVRNHTLNAKSSVSEKNALALHLNFDEAPFTECVIMKLHAS